MGRVHFGVILGWSVAQSVAVYFIANQVAANDGSGQRGLDLYACCCVTGYGMVPLILVSAALLLVPRCVRGGRGLCGDGRGMLRGSAPLMWHWRKLCLRLLLGAVDALPIVPTPDVARRHHAADCAGDRWGLRCQQLGHWGAR